MQLLELNFEERQKQGPNANETFVANSMILLELAKRYGGTQTVKMLADKLEVPNTQIIIIIHCLLTVTRTLTNGGTASYGTNSTACIE
jgi:hypothetical protein